MKRENKHENFPILAQWLILEACQVNYPTHIELDTQKNIDNQISYEYFQFVKNIPIVFNYVTQTTAYKARFSQYTLRRSFTFTTFRTSTKNLQNQSTIIC